MHVLLSPITSIPVLSLTDLEEQNYLKPKPKFEGKQYAYYPRLDISPEEDRTPLEQIQPKQPLSRGTKKKSSQPPPPLHPSQGSECVVLWLALHSYSLASLGDSGCLHSHF